VQPSPTNLTELSSLRALIQEQIARAGKTLIWFADQFARTGAIPLNIWRRLDRPFGREVQTLGLAFDVWHAMLRADRTLRLPESQMAERLREAARRVHDRLVTSTDVAPLERPEAYGRRVASDEIFGTFNAVSAAAVLRAEVYPERFQATPSYLAGHVLVAELSIAREVANTHKLRGIGERFPRLAVVSQGVHSLMLYVEHLEKRATLFTNIQEEILAVERLTKVVEDCAPGTAPEVAQLWNGHLRIAMARLASLCNDCGSLLLATKTFFEKWRDCLEERAHSAEPVTLAHLSRTLTDALARARDDGFARHVSDRGDRQRAAFERTVTFCHGFAGQYEAVHGALAAVLTISPGENCLALIRHLLALKRGLEALEQTSLGGTAAGEYPSIRDAARFQFARMLVTQFSDDSGELCSLRDLTRPETRNRLRQNLRMLNVTYHLEVDEAAKAGDDDDPARYACKLVRALGDSALGQNVLQWWQNHAKCYASPPLEVFKGPTKDFPNPRDNWILLRHRSFEAIAALREALYGTPSLSTLADALATAAAEERRIGAAIRLLVRKLTDWCWLQGQQLLAAGRAGPSQAADAHELAAALWVADRIGEPWDETLEAEAAGVIRKLQWPDGSFGPSAPLYQNRGFTFYLPSASAIAVMARFATGGTRAPRTPHLQRRLHRWAPVLVRGAQFLSESMVGYDPLAPDVEAKRDLAGWHSDRHPETERIDCLTTTEAVTALCRLDDALKWLLNLEAVSEFQVEWPDPKWSSALATDTEKAEAQLLLTVARLRGWHRANSELYTVSPQLDSRYADYQDAVEHHAFVLFGPPGTGKTYFQKILAGELGWPLVTLTIGDFLRDGEDKVGRRAVEVFQRLSFLSNVCIVFDEFDEMIPARGERGERSWPSPPLLTAAMLPLLATLRTEAKRNSCLVTFTTNYIENIDQAAIRGGRVDETILLMYPDYCSRLLLGLIAQAESKTAPCAWKRLVDAAVNSALCTQPDVVNYMGRVRDRGGAKDLKLPQTAIDWNYYGDLREVNQPLRDRLEELWRSIGTPKVRKRWLGNHPGWTHLGEVLGNER